MRSSSERRSRAAEMMASAPSRTRPAIQTTAPMEYGRSTARATTTAIASRNPPKTAVTHRCGPGEGRWCPGDMAERSNQPVGRADAREQEAAYRSARSSAGLGGICRSAERASQTIQVLLVRRFDDVPDGPCGLAVLEVRSIRSWSIEEARCCASAMCRLRFDFRGRPPPCAAPRLGVPWKCGSGVAL